HRVAVRAHSHATGREIQLQAQRPGELAGAVGHHAHLVLRALLASPGAHHEGVVDGHAPDLVDTLGAQGVGLADIAGNVLRRARGGEGAGQAEDHDLAAADLVGDLERVRPDRASLALGIDVFVEGGFGQGVPGLYRHGVRSCAGGSGGPWYRCRLPVDSRPAAINSRTCVDTGRALARGPAGGSPGREGRGFAPRRPGQSACLRRNAGMSKRSTPLSSSARAWSAALPRGLRQTAGWSYWS